MPWALVLLGISAGALFFYSRKGEAAEMTQEQKKDLPEIFRSVGAVRGVDPDLLAAVAFVESTTNPDAVRWNPPNDVSVGLMQILCTPPADAKPGDDYVCQNRLDLADQWPQTFSSLKADVETNVDIAAQLLAWNIRNYGFPRGLAVYNDFRARHASVGGPFPNDVYVNRVLARYAQIQNARKLKGA